MKKRIEKFLAGIIQKELEPIKEELEAQNRMLSAILNQVCRHKGGVIRIAYSGGGTSGLKVFKKQPKMCKICGTYLKV